MFEVNTPDGPRFLVQLVGPRSYRMGAQITHRGQTLPVSKRTRDYLVRKTAGAWVDFDPTPAEPIEEVMPPQFGEASGSAIDLDDIDPKKNPAISMEHAAQLAARGREVPTNRAETRPAGPQSDETPHRDPTLPQSTIDTSERGDMTSADLKGGKTPAPGGKTAEAKTGGVTVKQAPTKAKAKPQEEAGKDTGPVDVA